MLHVLTPRDGKRPRIRLFSLPAVVATAALSLAAFAGSGPTLVGLAAAPAAGPHCTSPGVLATAAHATGPNARAQQVDGYLRQYRMQHSAATQSQIDATLADKLCLVRLDPTSTIALESDTNSAISPTVSVYYDNQAKDYYVIGSWNWNRNDWANDLNENGCLNACTKNDGQPDGWAIATNQPVVVQGESSSWWGGWYFGQSVSSAATTVNQNGAGFKVQDTARWSVTNGWDYNMLHGEEVFDFYHLVNGCTSYFQPFFTYGHTWSSTSITGFSISNSGASISFSSSSNGWQRAVSGNYISAC